MISNYNLLHVLFIITALIIISIIVIHNQKPDNKTLLNKSYYEVDEVEPHLNTINKFKYDILDEVINIDANDCGEWVDWPEDLYSKDKSWKIYPLNVFGKWINKNCDKCHNLTQFLKSIPNLKLAILSKMSAGTVLLPHQGWKTHSNYSIRCQYGLIVPDNCFVQVMNDNNMWEKKFQKTFEWLIFDDSLRHNAENLSNEDRIILILDIERPKNISIGKSNVEDTKELLEIIKSIE